MLGCVAPDVLAAAAGSLTLSLPKLFTSARFLPPRSGLMNLAVGFNPRLRVKYFPRRVATIEPTRAKARAGPGIDYDERCVCGRSAIRVQSSLTRRGMNDRADPWVETHG